MKKGILALALILGSATTAYADTSTRLSASPATAVVGQAVTFTATFFFACADGVASHGFTVDGKAYADKLSSTGQNATATLTLSKLSVGTHIVTYTWSTSMPPNGAACGGTDTLKYVVKPQPAPPPPPKPSPVVVASTSPTLPPPGEVDGEAGRRGTSPTPAASSARLTADLDSGQPASPVGLFAAGGVVVLVVLAAAGPLLSRR